MAVIHSDLDSTIEEKLTETLRFIDFFKRTHVPDGEAPPPFYEGLLSDATCLAWNAPAPRIKMLALYFHDSTAPCSAAFASHLLMDEARRLIADQAVLWGWDVSGPHRWHLMCEMVLENFGNGACDFFQELDETSFPCMVLLSRGKEGIELVQLITPTDHKFNFLSALYYAVDLFAGKIKPELTQKENSKKQKSLFCGGSWTKVTEAMAIDAHMATYKFSSSAGPLEDKESGQENHGRDDDLDLEGILRVRQMAVHGKSGGTSVADAAPSSSLADQPGKSHKWNILSKLMENEIKSRRCAAGNEHTKINHK